MSRLSSQLRFNDLTGGINNTYSKEDVNSSTKKTETPDMVNVEYFKLGGLKTMKGNTRVGLNDYAIQTSPVVGGWEYTKNNKRYMVIGLQNGDVRIYDKSLDKKDSVHNPFRLIYKFPSQSNRMSFCNMNNGVVITNGIDDLVFYEINRQSNVNGYITTGSTNKVSGSSTRFGVDIKVGDGININGNTYYVESIESSNVLYVDRNIETQDEVQDYKLKLADTSLCNAYLTNSDPDVKTGSDIRTPIRGLAIQFYSGRLWVGGKNGLYYSAVGLPNNWDVFSDAGAIYDLYNDSSEVTALGLFSEFLMIHKKFSTYILSLEGEANNIIIKPFSNITCESQQSWIVSNTKYYIYSKDFMDIYPLVQHTIFNDKFLGEPITQKVRDIFKTVLEGKTKDIFCVSRPRERQMLFYMPTVNCSGSGEALIFDFQTKSWILRRLPRETNVTIAFNYNNNIYIGTKDGLVLKEFSGNNFTVKTDTTHKGNKIVEDNQYFKGYVEIPYVWNDGDIQTISFHFYVNGEYHSSYMNARKPNSEEDLINLFEGERTFDSIEIDGDLYFMSIYDIDGKYLSTDRRDLDPDEPVVPVRVNFEGKLSLEYKGIEDIYSSEDYPINAYYKSPWFDWAGNYMHSFAEFFIECDSDKRNKFVIRTQRDGTSRYEDRVIDDDKFVEKQNILIWDSNKRKWDKDKWAKETFDSIRMLLPNSIFESFQVEFKTEPDKLNQGFHIYQYGFRRIETEEAPW